MPSPVSNTSYNSANQMLTYEDKSITYDENGNMTSVANTCGTTTYTWDVRNRLVGISGFNTDCSPLSASFGYDALGRRIQKTVNGVTTEYVYDGLDIIQEKQNSAVSANYIRTLNIDEPLARIKADGSVRYYQQDSLGSVISLSDETGEVKTQYSYDPYGNVTITGEITDNPFQFTGRENDGTGLYYYRFRYYNPELQRFISEDPIGFEGGDSNIYLYVGADPVNWIDPLGLREYNWILDWPEPIITPFMAYDFRNTMRAKFLIEYQKSGNVYEYWKDLSEHYSCFDALIDMYRFDADEAMEYYRNKLEADFRRQFLRYEMLEKAMEISNNNDRHK